MTWTIGRKTEYGTRSADTIYDENGKAILMVYGKSSNSMLEDLDERDAAGLAVAKRVVEAQARIEALEAAIADMKEQVSQNSGIRNEYQDFDDFFLIADKALTGKAEQ